MQLTPPLSLKQLAGIIQVEYEGDPDYPISGINEIHMVQPGDLTFVDHPKYYDKALNSPASGILIDKKIPPPAGKVMLYSKDPFSDFVALIRKFRPFEPASGLISPTAIIGQHTIIQPGAFIGNHVVIGDHCIIHPNVTIYDHCVIGNHVVLHSGTVIGADGLYYKRRPGGWDKLVSGGRVILEDHVELGACCAVDRGSTGDTRIGQGTKIDNLVHIAHDVVIGKNCLIAGQSGVAGCVVIEDDVIIWGQSGIQKNVRIGRGAAIMGKSVVTKSVEGGKSYLGFPAIPLREALKEAAHVRRIPQLFAMLKNLRKS